MSFTLTHGKGFVDAFFHYDSRTIDRLVGEFGKNANEQLENAIVDILKRELRNTQRYIKGELPPSQQDMATAVADSLAIEVLKSKQGEVEIRFGSDPMDGGGVSGSRGGKLALYLQHGVGQFPYGFTFKTIQNTRFWGGGEGFINAKTGDNMTHRGFKRIGWLEHAQEGALPDIEAAILEALEKEWG
tara:strand:- start:867 stop:1427 length:561 start_codon:yes stop_codon:yes gene_type:complete